ncbi:MAG TPA: hypothetical protein VI524_05330 [Anaerolineales bacterium]|nr:hypothetical protein [Anaerolineales bacterium]
MNTQIFTRPATICTFLVALPEPIQASSRDYGFDFDEVELAEGLLAPLPTNPGPQPMSEVAAEEFESRYLSFLS